MAIDNFPRWHASLRHPARNIPLPGGEPCKDTNVFFWPIGIFSLPVAGLSSCSRLRGNAGSPPGPRTQAWALAEVGGTCSGGSKWQIPSGSDSEHVKPSRLMQTQAHFACYNLTWVEKCPASHVISMILNVVNDDKHYFVMEKVFARYLARHSTTFSTKRYNLHGFGRIVSSHARSCEANVTTKWLGLHLRPTSARVQQQCSK